MMTEENNHPPRGIFKKDLPLDEIVRDESNERQTLHKLDYLELKLSIAKYGVLNGIIVEKKEDGYYHLIGGERRWLAAQEVGYKTIPGKIYTDLTPKQRIKMQIAENITKTPIPTHETAEKLWTNYTSLLAYNLVNKDTQRFALMDDLNKKFTSYEKIPEEMKTQLSLQEFATEVNMSEKKIRDAFHYVNLHSDIKRRVQEHKLSYSFALQFGRITNKNQQISTLKTVLGNQQIKTAKQASKWVTEYIKANDPKKSLEELSQEFKEAFYSSATRNENRNYQLKEMHQQMIQTIKMFETLKTWMTIDPSIKKLMISYQGNKKNLVTIIESAQDQFNQIRDNYANLKEYQKVVENLHNKKLTIKEQILRRINNLNKETREAKSLEEEIRIIDTSEPQFLDLKYIHRDESQPRKTFNKENIARLANSIEEIGLMSPILVKELSEKEKKARSLDLDEPYYQIIFGESRVRAHRLKGFKEIESLVITDITDFECNLLQYAEDLCSEVRPAERAKKMYTLYHLRKQEEENFTLKDFIKEQQNIGAETISKALLFASLPPETQFMYKEGLLNYSTAIKIGELWEKHHQQQSTSRNNEEREKWINGWSFEASLWRYDQQKVNTKIEEIETQPTFEFLNSEHLEEGRKREAIKQAGDYIQQFCHLVNQNTPKDKKSLGLIFKGLESYQTLMRI